MITLGQLDRSDERSPYVQIAAALREAINLGRVGPGDRLPSESELTQHYRVARMTVRQAIQELKSEGLVTSEHGRGVFVRAAPVVRRLASERFARQHRDRGKAAFLAEAEKAGYSASVDSIRVHESPAPAEAAQRLGLAVGDPVIVRERRYLANGEPVETATSYIPVTFARGRRAGQTVGGAVPGAIRPQREARMGAMPDTMQPAPLPSAYQLRVVVRGVSPLIWRAGRRVRRGARSGCGQDGCRDAGDSPGG